MAAPQFFTPQRASSSGPSRRFTLEQANKSLPLVKRIVADIVAQHSRAAASREMLEHLTAAKDVAGAQAELEASITRLQDLIDELSDVGVELKDYEKGLVDFVGRHDGRDVYLCWKLGEEQITHWHELETGFSGRKPVSTLREKE
jgi:hypothetical protein